MTHKHNFIFKAASVLCMALVIVLLSSFVYPVANEVSAKEATSTTVIIPPPYLASAPAVTEGTEIQPEEESVDVSAPVVPYTEEDLDLLARLITALPRYFIRCNLRKRPVFSNMDWRNQ